MYLIFNALESELKREQSEQNEDKRNKNDEENARSTKNYVCWCIILWAHMFEFFLFLYYGQ